MIRPSLNCIAMTYELAAKIPKYYTVSGQAPGLRGKKVHYSRCIRLEGIRLPYWQRLTENLWAN